MLASDYYIFTRRRRFVQRHPYGVLIGGAVLAAFAVHFLVVELAAQDRIGYGRQDMRFAFAQPEFRTYLAGKAARERHIAISRVLTRAAHTGASATAPSASPKSSVRVAGDGAVKPASRAPPAREETGNGGGTGLGQQKLRHAVMAVGLEQNEGGLQPASRVASVPAAAKGVPPTQVGAAVSQTDVRPRSKNPRPRRARARRPQVKPKPNAVGPMPISGLPEWAHAALFQPD